MLYTYVVYLDLFTLGVDTCECCYSYSHPEVFLLNRYGILHLYQVSMGH